MANAKVKVLIADDSSMIRKILAKDLNKLGIIEENILEAKDGDEALQMIKLQNPSIMIVDHIMPKLTGLELIKAARNIIGLENVPIIMVSSVLTNELINNLKELGVTNYVRKPFDKEQISAALKIAMESVTDVSQIKRLEPHALASIFAQGGGTIKLEDDSRLVIQVGANALEVNIQALAKIAIVKA